MSLDDRARLLRLQQKRERRRLKKLAKLRRRRRARAKTGKEQLPWGPVVAPYIDFSGIGDQKSGSATVRFQKVFSFFEDPDAALKTLGEMALAIRQHPLVSVDQQDI